MEVISELQNIDLTSWIIVGFMIMAIIVTFYEVICKVCAIFNRPIGAMKQRKADHALLVETVQDLKQLHEKHKEDTKQSIKHDKIIKEDLRDLSETILQIKDEVTLMRTQRDGDKLAEYKDKIGESYRFYSMRKYSDEEPVPYWNHMEKEALKGLITQYEIHGGSNSFVHSIVEPKMETWKVID